jgi:hypothetical protein
MVSVAVFELSLERKLSGLGENEAVAPRGKVVVTDKVAVKPPDEPGTEPRFTVIVYVAELPAVTGEGDWALTTTEPTFVEASVNSVVAWAPEASPLAVSKRDAPAYCSSTNHMVPIAPAASLVSGKTRWPSASV